MSWHAVSETWQRQLEMRVPGALRSLMYNRPNCVSVPHVLAVLRYLPQPKHLFNDPTGASSPSGPDRPSSRGTSTTHVSCVA
jgi:hypothetical protein